MSAAATAAMVAATSALRASGAHIDARTEIVELLACVGIAIVTAIVVCLWCDRS